MLLKRNKIVFCSLRESNSDKHFRRPNFHLLWLKMHHFFRSRLSLQNEGQHFSFDHNQLKANSAIDGRHFVFPNARARTILVVVCDWLKCWFCCRNLLYNCAHEGTSHPCNILFQQHVRQSSTMNKAMIIAVNTQLKRQLRKESLKKIQAWTGFEPMTSAIPVKCSSNWAIKPTGSHPRRPRGS